MKMNTISSVIAGLILSASMANTSFAADQGHGTITLKGAIIDAPCSIKPESVDQTIDLGQISNVTLKKDGKSALRNFQIELEGCDVATMKSVTTTFTGPASANNGKLLGVTGSAQGAGIAIVDGSGKLIELGKPTSAQIFQAGNNTLSFAAYLQSEGEGDAAVIVPGDFQTISNFTLAYQ